MKGLPAPRLYVPTYADLWALSVRRLLQKTVLTAPSPQLFPLDEIAALEYSSRTTRCGGCENNCLLTVNTFSGNRKYITGNRCEKRIGELGRLKKVPIFSNTNETAYSITSRCPKATLRAATSVYRECLICTKTIRFGRCFSAPSVLG